MVHAKPFLLKLGEENAAGIALALPGPWREYNQVWL